MIIENRDTKRKLSIFLSIFILKLCYLIFVLKFNFAANYTLWSFNGDGIDYLNASLNLVNEGEYRFGGSDGVTEYVYRMPGMASILAPLLYIFSFSLAVKIFILFQTLLLSVAVTYLFFYLKKNNKNKIMNYSLFLFLSIGSYLNQYLSSIIAETISVSLFIIISCYLLQKKEFKISAEFLIICLLFTWLFFLRPFMIVFLPLFCIRILNFEGGRIGIKLFIKNNLAVGLLIFVIFFLRVFGLLETT
ncbi:MAG TPA: hypothetical protein VK835_09505 [Bacteroidia bacterium]|jgi:hypothetical protein|nr:hypothetical protein [Bacteroidia bacterium]